MEVSGVSVQVSGQMEGSGVRCQVSGEMVEYLFSDGDRGWKASPTDVSLESLPVGAAFQPRFDYGAGPLM